MVTAFVLGGGGVLFSAFVPVGTGSDASLSFLGVIFDAGELISGVRITTGNTALGPNDGAGGADVVVMDDFLYGEPVAVPAPGGLALFALGAGLLLIRARRRRARQKAARLGLLPEVAALRPAPPVVRPE